MAELADLGTNPSADSNWDYINQYSEPFEYNKALNKRTAVQRLFYSQILIISTTNYNYSPTQSPAIF